MAHRMKINDILHIVEGFKNRSLPEEEWTHEAHLITALCLLNEHGLEKAEEIMPGLIRDFNTAKGGVNSSTEGYHHTITIFYLRVIEKFRLNNKDLSIETQVGRLLTTELAKPYFTLNYYSKERLFTAEARLGLVAPDLQGY